MQSFLGFIITPLELGVVALAVAVGNAGVGIILFTIAVRLVLAPLMITQLRSSRSMQRVQPMVAELRQKHGKDRKALSEATMALYREHGVNPAMGCLPTLLQFPILIGLFYAFFHLGNSVPIKFPHSCNGYVTHDADQWFKLCYAIKGTPSTTQHIYNLFHAQFLWLRNGLGQPDPLFILPILAGVTQWIQSRMMLTRSSDPQQQMMNSMMNFMPLLIVFFATRYASGLSLYWVTSTIIAIAIQYPITGWGLLPAPATLLAGLRGPRPATRPRSSKPASARTTPRPSKPAAPPLDGDSPPSGEAPPATASVDGRNGVAKPQKKTTAAVQRRKANRARGGRGGRRG